MSPHDAQFSAADALIGKQFDEYLIEAQLGSGGMAQVYRALDRKLGRRVALKVIASQYRVEDDYNTRFEREAQSIGRLEHPNIVRLYRYGQVGDVSYMAMQFIEGADLDYLIRSYRQTSEFMSPADVLNVVRDIALALDYAHEQGVIHRDVKPGNIILDKSGRAFLSDFGLALLSDIGTHGEILGSPLYIAPEQAISSANVVPQSDLYSLGVVLFEMLTGELPFVAPNLMDVAMRHVSDPPPRPEQINPAIPAAVSEVVLRCLEKEPAARYQSGAALVKALERAVTAWTMGAASTRQSHLRAAHMTNPEKVQLRLDAPDAATLPPLPAPPPNPARATATVMAAPRPADQPNPTRQPTPTQPAPAISAPNRAGLHLPLPGAIAAVAVVLIGFLILRMVSSTPANIPTTGVTPEPAFTSPPVIVPTLTLVISAPTDAPTPTAIILSVQPTPTLAEAAPTLVPTITAIVIQPVAPPTEVVPPSPVTPIIPTIPTVAPTLLATPTARTLAILRDEDWIVFLNTSTVPLLLDRFEMQQKDRTLKAVDWGVSVLPPGDCLRLYKGNNAPKQAPERCTRNIYDYNADKKTREAWFKGEIKVSINDTTSYEIRKDDD